MYLKIGTWDILQLQQDVKMLEELHLQVSHLHTHSSGVGPRWRPPKNSGAASPSRHWCICTIGPQTSSVWCEGPSQTATGNFVCSAKA